MLIKFLFFRLMFLQFAIAAVISDVAMLIFEIWDWQAVKASAVSLLASYFPVLVFLCKLVVCVPHPPRTQPSF